LYLHDKVLQNGEYGHKPRDESELRAVGSCLRMNLSVWIVEKVSKSLLRSGQKKRGWYPVVNFVEVNTPSKL